MTKVKVSVELHKLPGTSLYTEVSMYDAEMGGLSRY